MTEDPREHGPEPPFEEQSQEPPGLESEMSPKPDYGAELAPVYVFLASRESSYVCGEVVGVTGGKPLP